eukprot:gene15906-18861_t
MKGGRKKSQVPDEENSNKAVHVNPIFDSTESLVAKLKTRDRQGSEPLLPASTPAGIEMPQSLVDKSSASSSSTAAPPSNPQVVELDSNTAQAQANTAATLKKRSFVEVALMKTFAIAKKLRYAMWSRHAGAGAGLVVAMLGLEAPFCDWIIPDDQYVLDMGEVSEEFVEGPQGAMIPGFHDFAFAILCGLGGLYAMYYELTDSDGVSKWRAGGWWVLGTMCLITFETLPAAACAISVAYLATLACVLEETPLETKSEARRKLAEKGKKAEKAAGAPPSGLRASVFVLGPVRWAEVNVYAPESVREHMANWRKAPMKALHLWL